MSSAKLPLAPVVERCSSKPVSLLELSCQETSIRLSDTATALVLDGAAGAEPDPAVDAASSEGAVGCLWSQPLKMNASNTAEYANQIGRASCRERMKRSGG